MHELFIITTYQRVCHKSYAINPKFITNLDKTTYTVTLQFNDKVFSIPIGRKYKETLLRKMD